VSLVSKYYLGINTIAGIEVYYMKRRLISIVRVSLGQRED